MKYFVLTLLFVLSFTFAEAQVVIGSDLVNERAAILDLKSQESAANNITATTGGLLLPRVALVNLNTLEPFIATTDAEWINPSEKEALQRGHIGLEIYNTTDNGDIKPGTFLWDGTKWRRVFRQTIPGENNRIIFPLPAFNLPLIDSNDPENTRLTVNLYQVYSNNMLANNFITNMANKSDFVRNNLYGASELDYVVTHYDKEIIDIHSISNTGVMEYTVKNINPGPDAFLNVYLVVHKGKEKN
ncbi:hypothetical protein [Myroides sp. WP-1]|uniref:hypothetical protein n=1 Tax=Myroides sp. WP-1 TaxID=2759944 RepID=UPI0015F8DE1B|nr:hypothetical protein [Myroides sp. WP-1]MBB1139661.1 hypothetical protein [Myroides sp. WP-1]